MKNLRGYSFPGVFLALLLLMVFCVTAPVEAAPSWNVQVVDVNATGGPGGYSPIVLDYGGTPHVAYTGHNPPYRLVEVRYASWNGSDWDIQTIAGGEALSLVFDSHNNPHILYHDPWQKSLMYASRSGINWSTQTVDEKTSSGDFAFDSLDNPHVAYSDGKAVKYASLNGSAWTIQTVDAHSEIPSQLSLVIDSNDTPYILYGNPNTYEDKSTGIDYHSKNIKLAVLENSVWNIQTVPLAHPIGEYSNIVLDSQGYPHFTFTQFRFANPPDNMTTLTTLLYASWDGTAWKTQVIASDLLLKFFGSLTLDSLDYPHISYISAEELIYVGYNGIAWITQSVDADIAWRGPSQITVDSNRIPHISYLINPPNIPFVFAAYLKYATATEAFPSVVNVDSNSTVTAFVFDNKKSELTFNVSGESGTMGYACVSVAKSYLGNVDNSKVYLDGKQVDYQVSSNEDSWVLAFTYQHSTHQVRVEFASFPALLLGGIVIAAIVIALATLTTAIHWRKQKRKNN